MKGVSKLFRTSKKGAKPLPSSPLPEGLCHQFSLTEMKIATNNFDANLVVGEGDFGTVYKGFFNDCNGTRIVIIKRVKLEDLRNEVVFVGQLHHPNLISLIGYCIDEGVNILVYEFVVNGDLFRKLHDDHDRLSWKQRLKICVGVARALHYLHTGVKQTIIYGDVKPVNILLDKNWEAKLSDFRLSNMLRPGFKFVEIKRDSETTLRYLDPECFITYRLTDKTDVYSFGVVLLEVLCGREAMDFKLMEKRQGLVKWAQKCKREGTLNEIIDPYLMGKIDPECFKIYVDIAISCVRSKGEARPSMGEVELILEHALELQQSADVAMKDEDPTGDVCIYPIDEYTCTVRYLDPENLDKSDVYSFGVLLFDVLCARKRNPWHLDMLSWAKKVTINQIIDPYLMGKIAPECFNIYKDIATSCAQIEGKDRPTMNEYTSSSSLPELEEFLSDSDSLREYI
ncbi:receptor-like protein kinase FERONIA isoform X5 [Quercus suber]|uniref:receptor-like protein kinase FERONIA isoform X5 n=1 Tax=Quercus suber TaxID=58331 RepID=UPI0032E03E8D